ncbi:hypothetical protein HUE56_25270 (plasmid) [Azospirillum oryzae]|uniref:Uncharacterized protein n=1 Tax=Azospirillum oryzae TaxID=286727 RepID=A0A6N1AQY5_9PROT|nr:hypothetical protein [Azospirillum oryzae]KAA0587717.1 hypothetical protein FZ938_16035 [Azospirillum oryzae]QKS53829.1 hypothetical protein HUE56_25270 [Azospirillum oryzae]
MKSFALSTIFSIAALLSAGVANAQQKPVVLSALPSQNFAFCLSSDATVVISTTLQNEVGVVVTNVGNSQTNTSGTVVVAANKFLWQRCRRRVDVRNGGVHPLRWLLLQRWHDEQDHLAERQQSLDLWPDDRYPQPYRRHDVGAGHDDDAGHVGRSGLCGGRRHLDAQQRAERELPVLIDIADPNGACRSDGSEAAAHLPGGRPFPSVMCRRPQTPQGPNEPPGDGSVLTPARA